MLNLIILYLALLINLFRGCYLVYIADYKCLGMQTLLDCVLCNSLKTTMICFISFTITCTLITFHKEFDPIVAKFILLIWYLASINSGLSLAAVAIIRYILVFHGKLLYSVQDYSFIRYLRIVNLVLSVSILALDNVFFYDFEENSQSYRIMTKNSNSLEVIEKHIKNKTEKVFQSKIAMEDFKS